MGFRTAILIAACLAASRARAADGDVAPEDWSIHGQLTAVGQGDPGFHSPYQGPNSLSGNAQTRETISGTAYLGRRLPWLGGELYFDPEFNQGFGLSRTEGLEGFPNGEASKAGFDTPKPNVARLFLRQTFGLGGDQEDVDADKNQLAGRRDVARVTVTAGKFAASDIFDNNQYAHDQRVDFLNLSFWESAAWDYPADAKGYTDGVAVELNAARWAIRGGWFLEPKIANQRDLDPRFLKRYGTAVEIEERHTLWDAPGTLRTLLFLNRAPMGNFDQALAIADATGVPPDITLVRRDKWKVGAVLNLEQELANDLGFFTRLSWNDGRSEGWSFTDVTRALAVGLSLKGGRWGRKDDVVAFGAAVNGTSKGNRNFLAAGGTGILDGDGRLDYAPEAVIETYYKISFEPAELSFDYQFAANPAFNQDRGPVSIFAVRLHVEF
jgi:high affinity Mn2+ porin